MFAGPALYQIRTQIFQVQLSSKWDIGGVFSLTPRPLSVRTGGCSELGSVVWLRVQDKRLACGKVRTILGFVSSGSILGGPARPQPSPLFLVVDLAEVLRSSAGALQKGDNIGLKPERKDRGDLGPGTSFVKVPGPVEEALEKEADSTLQIADGYSFYLVTPACGKLTKTIQHSHLPGGNRRSIQQNPALQRSKLKPRSPERALCSSDYPRTHYVAKAHLELLILLPSPPKSRAEILSPHLIMPGFLTCGLWRTHVSSLQAPYG
ncbi:hypothetical protein STEG23_001888 [Scotinomys teguina]